MHTMTSAEMATINFVNHIPHDVNPYIKVAHRMQALINLPHFPPWLTTIQCCTVLLYLIILAQAVKLLHIHIRAEHFTLVSFCQLGLIQIDFPNIMAVVHILYAPLVIFDLIFLQLVNAGHVDLSGEIILFGCKFLLLEIGPWSFVWVCACQVVTHFYASPSNFSTMMPKKQSRTLNPIVQWCANTSFFAVILIPACFVGYCYVRANDEYNTAKRILHAVVGDIYFRAGQFNPQTYSSRSLLLLLTPASAIIPHGHLIAHFTRVGIIYHLALLIFLTLIYIPTLWISLRRIYTEANLEKKLCAPLKELQGEARDKLSRTVLKTRSQRRTIVLQATIWFSGTFIALFVLIAQLSFKGDDYLRDERWIVLTYIGLHLPFGILGNIILFTLNGYALQKYPQSNVKSVRERPILMEEGGQFTTNGLYQTQELSSLRAKIQQIPVSQGNLSQLAESPLIVIPMSTHKKDPRKYSSSGDSYFLRPDINLHHGEQPP